MIVYTKNIIYIRTHLRHIFSSFIPLKNRILCFCVCDWQKGKNIQNLYFFIFLRPVATVTDKLLRGSPYHGVRIPIIARFQSIPLIVYGYRLRTSCSNTCLAVRTSTCSINYQVTIDFPAF